MSGCGESANARLKVLRRHRNGVLQGAVAQFVDNTLQGSVSPFVAYLSQRQQVSDNELAELEALVAQLQSRRHEG